MLLSLSARRRESAQPIPYALPTSAPWNAPMPAIVPSRWEFPEYPDSAIHPGVVDMGAAGWRGYRYWMGNTSFYNNMSGVEQPFVVVSHNGYEWFTPAGGSNPLVLRPETGWHSDTDLVYDPDADQMICMFRLNYQSRVMRTSDGRTWSAPEPFDWPPLVGEQASPSVLRIAPGEWWVWTVNVNADPLRMRLFKGPSPVGPWTGTLLPGSPMTGDPRGTWHFDVIRDSGGVFRALAQAGANTPGQTIWAASSLDGETWTNSATPVLSPSASGGWDDESLYRPTLTEHEDGVHFRVWYGGKQSGPLWLTGYTQIARSEWPTPPTP